MCDSQISHSSHKTHLSPLSPDSPQVWIMPVYKGVHNRHVDVRFAVNVRLSPPVDQLWTRKRLLAACFDESVYIDVQPVQNAALDIRRPQPSTDTHTRVHTLSTAAHHRITRATPTNPHFPQPL